MDRVHDGIHIQAPNFEWNHVYEDELFLRLLINSKLDLRCNHMLFYQKMVSQDQGCMQYAPIRIRKSVKLNHMRIFFMG
jgi:hypothetical protein